MNNFLDLLNKLKPQETQTTEIPFAPAATMPDDLQALAMQEAQEQVVPVSRAPALGSNAEQPISRAPASSSSMTKTSQKISGTLPSPAAPEEAEQRLERLMRELSEERGRQVDDANSRQLKAGIAQSIVGNLGNLVAGSQAMNTGASVTAPKVAGLDIGDLVGKVDKRFAGDQEALLNQYKMLMNSKDKQEQRKYQQESLNIQREGMNLKRDLASLKAGNLKASLSPGEEAADKAFAKDYNNFTSKGFTNAQTAINNLKKISEELKVEGDGYLASGGGRTSVLPDSMRSRESIRRRNGAGNEAVATLKELFPGSISDGEREASRNAYYDDQLGNKDNAVILDGKIKQLEQSLIDQQAKAAYFSKHGTLKGMGVDNASKPSGVNGTPPAPESNGMITVSDGTETMQIPEADEAEAAQDGFKRIK